MMSTLVVPMATMMMNMNQLKNRSSAITTIMSNKTTDINEAKKSFKTISGFLLEIGMPLSAYETINEQKLHLC
jgi:hypothetical protein